MNEIIRVFLRTFLVLFLLFIMLKVMGKKQLSQLNLFDYITGITIGSIVADISLDIEKSLLSGIICLLIYCIISISISSLSLKSIKLRSILDGKETVLIQNGKIIRDNLAINKITINDLITEARLMGYFNIKDIYTAILEPNGKISFELKEKEKPLTKKDYLLNSLDKGLVYNLIIDGEVVKENLKKSKITISWLEHELKVIGKKKEDILLLTVDSDKSINYYLK